MYFFRILFVGYKYIHVSCTLKPLTRNHSSQFSIKTAQSVVYLVEQFANRSNTGGKFVVFVRRGERIHITFDVSSGNSSGALAKYRELIVGGQLWTTSGLVTYVLSIIVIVLCSPVMVLAFRASEIVGNKNNHLPYPVTVSESTSQEDATLHNHPRPQTMGITDDLSHMPTNKGKRVAILQSAKYDRTRAEMVTPHSPKPGASSASSTSGIDNPMNSNDRSRLGRNYALEKNPIQHDESFVPAPTEEQLIASRDCVDEHLIEVRETSESIPKEAQSVASESTDEIRMILVGKNPVALESWIGNCLFVNSTKGRDNTKSLDTP